MTAKPNGQPPFKIPGYATFFLPKILGRTRGLITFVKNSVPSEKFDFNSDVGKATEVLAVKIYLDSGPFLLFNIHRRRAQHKFFLQPFLQHPFKSVLLGDFNAHHPRWGPIDKPATRSGRDLAEQLDDFNDYICINHSVATRHKSGLDLAILHNDLAAVSDWDIHPTLNSDHFATITTIHTSVPDIPPAYIPKWKIDRADWDKYRSKLVELSSTVNAPGSVQQQADTIINHISIAAQEAIPKSKSHNFKKDHWYSTDDLRKSKRIVNRALRNYRKHPNPNNKAFLKESFQHFKDLTLKTKNDSWRAWVEGLNRCTKPRSFWYRIKRVRGVPHRPPTHFDPNSKAEEIISHFSSRTATASLPPQTQLRLAELREGRIREIDLAASLHVDSDSPFTLQELSIALQRPKDSSPGDDLITYSMLRHAPPETHQLMLHLFNDSLSNGELPPSWKVASIVPIPKPNDDSFRPISLLPCISKIMEVMVLNRLFHVAQPLHQHTFGFKRKSGTVDAASVFLQDVTKHKKHGTIAVFLDITKAFDLSNSISILSSLVRAGVKGKLLSWLRDFLTDRKGFLRFQGGLSQVHDFENGTPQGSTLSPTLFNYLVDQLHDIQLPRGVKLLGYADDFVLYQPNNSHHIHNDLAVSLRAIEEKLQDIGLQISVNKTKVGYFGKKMNPPHFDLFIDNAPIEWVDEFKYLGVFIDRRLNFKRHALHLKTKARCRLDAMKVIASLTGVTADILRRIYIATVRSIIEYGSQFLGSGTKKARTIIDGIHKEGLRIIAGVPGGTAVDALEHELRLPPFDIRANIATAKFITKVARNEKHPLHANLATWSVQDRNLFLNKYWGIEATRTMLNLVPERRLPTSFPEPFCIPPWAPHPIVTKIYHPYKTKKGLNKDIIFKTAMDNILDVNRQADHVYYTDGSVSGRLASSAFCINHYSKGVRLGDGSTILQAELTAIHLALEHAFFQGNGQTVIHTDSLAAIHFLNKRIPIDNVLLYNNVMEAATRLPRPPILNWVPSHVGLEGNELADEAAAKATHREAPDIFIPTSTSFIFARIYSSAMEVWCTRAEHDPKATLSLKWNVSLIRNKRERKAIFNVPRTQQKELLRLRLRVLEPRIFEGSYICLQCGQAPRSQVTHYLACCPNTFQYRLRMLYKHLHPSDLIQSNSELALSVLNRQASRGYKELVAMLIAFPRR